MLMMITGGSGSGKSKYAEDQLVSLGNENKIYIATMIPWDQECDKKIERHRRMRARKGFCTVECYQDLSDLQLMEESQISDTPSVLLECMSNLVANELYREDTMARPSMQSVIDAVMEGIRNLKDQAKDVLIVTNEVSSDGVNYHEETQLYQKIMGALNQRIAREADHVIEVVFGIPIVIK